MKKSFAFFVFFIVFLFLFFDNSKTILAQPIPTPCVPSWGEWGLGLCGDNDHDRVIDQSCGSGSLQWEVQYDGCGGVNWGESRSCTLEPCCSLDYCTSEITEQPYTHVYTHQVDCQYWAEAGTSASISCVMDWGDGTKTNLPSCNGSSSHVYSYPSFGEQSALFSVVQSTGEKRKCSAIRSFCVPDWHAVPNENAWLACGYNPQIDDFEATCGHSFPYQFLKYEDWCEGEDYKRRNCQQPACASVVSCTDTNPGSGEAECAVTAESGADGSGTVKTFGSCILTWDTSDPSEGQTSVLSSNCNNPEVAKSSPYNPYGGEHNVSYKVVQPPEHPETVETYILCTTSYPSIPQLSGPDHKAILKSKNINLQWGLPEPADAGQKEKYGHNSGWGFGDTAATEGCQPYYNFEVYIHEGGEDEDFDLSIVGDPDLGIPGNPDLVYAAGNKRADTGATRNSVVDPSIFKWGRWYYWGIIAKNGTFSSNLNPFVTGEKRPIRAFKVDWPNSWFITYTGDVHGQNGITSARPAPDGQTSCDTHDYPEYFSNVKDYVSSGLITHNGSYDSGCMGDTEIVGLRPPLGYGYGGNIDQSKQRYNYDYFFDLISDKVPVGSVPDKPDRFYYISSSVSVDEKIEGKNDEKAIVFVDGDLTFDKDAEVDVKKKGFLAFIVKGEIKFDPKIKDKIKGGVYIAQTIRTGTKNPIVIAGKRETELHSCDEHGFHFNDYKDKTFEAEGIFIAWGDFYLERDLEPQCIGLSGKLERERNGDENLKKPGEIFYYTPNLLVFAPEEIKLKKLYWEEIAP